MLGLYWLPKRIFERCVPVCTQIITEPTIISKKTPKNTPWRLRFADGQLRQCRTMEIYLYILFNKAMKHTLSVSYYELYASWFEFCHEAYLLYVSFAMKRIYCTCPNTYINFGIVCNEGFLFLNCLQLLKRVINLTVDTKLSGGENLYCLKHEVRAKSEV